MEKVVLVDIDGTVAINDGHRGFFEWGKVGSDKPNSRVIELIGLIDLPVIFVSGRDECCRTPTTSWLGRNVLPHLRQMPLHLFMRASGDNRKDAIIKQEIFDAHIKPNYDVVAVFDDRDQVVDMWRKNGLLCCQVAPGDF